SGLKKTVETRAKGICECCGYGKKDGKESPELIVVFIAHHIIPVQFGGSDSTQNLILVCPTCHELIHKYEKQQFNPEQETYDRNNDIKRIVVLGNMILKMRGTAINTLKTKF